MTSGISSIRVVGDAILDVHVRPTFPIADGADVPAAIRLVPGGQGANLAVRLARQGLEVTLACALGHDPAGDMLRTTLAAEGVTCAEAAVEATGVVVVLGGDDGERSMLSQRVQLPRSAVAGRGRTDAWTVVSGYLLLQEDGPAIATALAAEGGRRALVACAVPDALVERWRAGLDAVAPDLVVANREEADRLLAGVDLPGIAVTDAAGAIVRIGEVQARAAAPHGPPAVDTTGAGDAFAAGLLAGIVVSPWPPTEPMLRAAVHAGVHLASAVARRPGAQALVEGERPGTLRP